jgi:RHS repeat-associated protein
MQNIHHIEPRRNYNALWRVALLLFFISSFCQRAAAQMSIFGTNCVTPGQTYTYSVSSSYVSANSQTYWELSGGVIAGTSSSIETRPGISSISVIWNDGGGVKAVNLHIYGGSNLSASLNVGTIVPLSLGSITDNVSQTVAYKSIPATITCSAASGGGCPPVIENYQWQQSTDQSVWTDIPGVIDQNLSFYSPIFTTTYFRRKVTSNSYQTGYSNVAVVNATPALKGGVATPAAQYILSGASPATLSVTTAGLGGGCSGNYTYQWFSSSDGINYSPVSGATGASYMPGPLTQTSYYGLKITCGSESVNSTTAAVYVNSPGIGSANQNFILTSIPRDAGIANPADPANTKVIQSVQYFDDLGRTMQAVQVKGSPLGKDIVQPIAYDNFGRESIRYLPYALTSGVSDGSYKGSALTQDQAAFYNLPQAGGIPVTPNPYAVTVFEPSPLNRVIEQGAPGQDWQPAAGHTLKVVYTTNDQTSTFSTTPGNSNLGSRIAALYQVSSINADQSRTLVVNGTYGPGQLYVTISKNENWNAATDGCTNTTEKYTDNVGHVVLKRTYNLNTTTNKIEELSTYYVYDDLGNLAFVLPPGSGADNALPAQTTLDNLCYQYRYDEQNRLTQKRIPGKGWVYMVYNQLDQPVLTQDANQRVSNQWSVIKYDAFGRVIMTGLWNAGAVYALSTLQINIYAVTQWDSRDQTNNTTNYPSGYILGSYPIITKTLTINYYDDYNNIPGLPPGYLPGAGSYSTMTKGLLTASKTAVLNTITNQSPDMLWNVNYYDDLGRVTRIYKQHYLGGTVNAANFDVVLNTYNFNNQVTTINRRHFTTASAGTPLLTINNQYDYDQMGRKTNTWEQITNGTNTPDPNAKILLSKTGYNELGQVSQKGLHGSSSSGPPAQGTDITLGSADALTSGQQKTVIASSRITLTPGFGAATGSTFIAQISSAPIQTINYTYNERGWLRSSSAPLFAEDLQYNTKIAQNGVTPTPQYNGNIAMQSWGTAGTLNKSTSYIYDQLNRLTTGNATTGNNENNISYDLMGNITALKRYTANNTLIDQLTYTYMAGTNKLQTVNDAITGTAGQKGGATNYTYDDNGNLLSDDSKGITGISYNLFNLPQTITGKNTSYIYDATGQKLRRVVGTATTDYIGGIQYEGTTTSAPVLSFIQTQEGRALPNGSTSYNYEYSLTDHLGNRRVNFDTSTGTARLVQTDDYYPFGMDIPSGTRVSPVNNYLYNGKELQENLGLLDYGFRFYDPVIARWNTADPLAEKHYDINPYNYGLNNPSRYMDYLGLDTISGGQLPDKWHDFKPGTGDGSDIVSLPEVKVTGGGSQDGFGGFGFGDFGFGGFGGGFGSFSMASYVPPPTLSSSSSSFTELSNRGANAGGIFSNIKFFGQTITTQTGIERGFESTLGDKFNLKVYESKMTGKKGILNLNETRFNDKPPKYDLSLNIGTYALKFNINDIGISTSLRLFGVGFSSGYSLGSGFSGGVSYTGENKITNGIDASFRPGGFTLIGAAIIIFVPEAIPVLTTALH